MTKVYLALYRGRKTIKSPFDIVARCGDWLTRKLTRGQYSHCEIAVHISEHFYCCYSSSVRDGGVRMKAMPLPANQWDLIKINANERFICRFYEQTKSCKYDFFGAVGVVLRIRQNHRCWFCSEWAAAALGFEEPWRFSPNDLNVICRNLNGK